MKNTSWLSISLLGAALCATPFTYALSAEADEASTGTAKRPRPTVAPSGGAAAARPILAWNDFDTDGRTDAFLVDASGQGVLLWNTGEGELAPANERFGLTGLPALASAAWQDVDADGWAELFLVTKAGEGRLLRNEAGRLFEDVSDLVGLTLRGVSEAYWMDFDGAGLPDLVSLSAEGSSVHRNLGNGTFERVSIPLVTPLPVTAILGTALPGDASEGLTGPTSTPEEIAGTARAAVGTTRVGVAPTETGEPRSPEALVVAHVSPLCAMSVEDQASGACLQASSAPTLGSLFPLSEALNVQPSGRVGIQTLAPGALLDVDGSGQGAGTVLRATSNTDEVGAFISATGQTQHVLQVEATNPNGQAADLIGIVDISVDKGFGPIRHTCFDDDGTNGARARMYDGSGLRTLELRASEFGSEGSQIEMWNDAGVSTIRIDAQDPNDAGIINLDQGDGLAKLQLRATDATSPGAELEMWSTAGNRSVHLISEEAAGNGAQLTLATAEGETTFVMDAEVGSSVGQFSMYLRDGTETVEIVAEETSGTGAQIVLRKADGSAGIVLDAEQGVDSRITTDTLQINGGADLVESFDVRGEAVLPGSVLVVDAQSTGMLALSTEAYDRRVVGVVSGAGGVKAGLSLGQDELNGDTPVALTGRVYVRCTAENGVIEPGDLLTTSSLAGHAMRATDSGLAFGAVIGKALSGFEPGPDGTTGLVLVLVSLQ